VRLRLVSSIWGVALSVALPALLASSASAAVTLGQLAPGVPASECSGSVPTDVLQPTVTGGNPYVVPSAGRIKSWTNQSASDPGQILTFKVYRPTEGLTYTVVGHDGPHPLTASAANTFTTSIAVQAGDVIGLHYGDNTAETACSFNAEDTYFERSGVSRMANSVPSMTTVPASAASTA